MKFRNPWIDPRVVHVRPEDVRAYLERRGWKPVGPATDPNLLRYERAERAEEAPTLFMPVRAAEKGPPLEQFIELIGDLSRFEERWAVEVLGDILQQAPAAANAAPGTDLPRLAEPANR
jgi:hypothetical protein